MMCRQRHASRLASGHMRSVVKHPCRHVAGGAEAAEAAEAAVAEVDADGSSAADAAEPARASLHRLASRRPRAAATKSARGVAQLFAAERAGSGRTAWDPWVPTCRSGLGSEARFRVDESGIPPGRVSRCHGLWELSVGGASCGTVGYKLLNDGSGMDNSQSRGARRSHIRSGACTARPWRHQCKPQRKAAVPWSRLALRLAGGGASCRRREAWGDADSQSSRRNKALFLDVQARRRRGQLPSDLECDGVVERPGRRLRVLRLHWRQPISGPPLPSVASSHRDGSALLQSTTFAGACCD